MKNKILGLFLILLGGTWTYFSTLFYSKGKLESLLSSDILAYIPFFVAISLIFISFFQYLICQNKKNCEDTNNFRIGFFASSIAISIILFIFEESFRLSRFYILFDSEYLIKSFFLYNPVLIFYFFYQILLYFFFNKGLIQEVEEEIL